MSRARRLPCWAQPAALLQAARSASALRLLLLPARRSAPCRQRCGMCAAMCLQPWLNLACARRRLLLALRAVRRRLVRSSTPRSRLAAPAHLGLLRRARRASRLAVLPSPPQLLRRLRLLLLWLPSPSLCPSRSQHTASPFRLRPPPARRLPARCVHALLQELCARCDADGRLRRRRFRQLRRRSSSARRRRQARPPWCRWQRRRARRQRSPPRLTSRPPIPRLAAVLLRAAAADRPRPPRLRLILCATTRTATATSCE